MLIWLLVLALIFALALILDHRKDMAKIKMGIDPDVKGKES